MGQKVHPEAMRVGYIHDWKSNWFNERNFSDYLAEDDAEPGARQPAPAPTPARPAARRTPRRRVVRARARYVRTSARKARMVCAHLPGKTVAQARAILAFTPREVARDWSKLLESAVANAEANHELVEDDLIIRAAYADEGPTIRRFRPRAMGRATPIRKRTRTKQEEERQES